MIQIRLFIFFATTALASLCQAQVAPKGNRLRELVRPDFAIGGALHAYSDKGGFSLGSYRDLAASEFTSVSAVGNMAKDTWKNASDFVDASGFLKVAEWAASKNLRIHARTLVDSHNNLQSAWFQNLPDNEVETKLHQYISSMTQATAGKVWAWDVVTGVIGNKDDKMDGDGIRGGEEREGNFQQYKEFSAMGQGYIAKALQWAHEGDPKAKLIISESEAEEVNDKSNRLFELCKRLKRQGAPINGVGFQHHWIDINVTPNYESIRTNMKRFADEGFEIYMTDVEVASTVSNSPGVYPIKEQIERQRTIYRSLVKLALEQPACKAFLMSDFEDDQSRLQRTDQPLLNGSIPKGSYLFPAIFSGGDSEGRNQVIAKRAYYGIQESLASDSKGLYRLTSAWDSDTSYLARNRAVKKNGKVFPEPTLGLFPKNEESSSWTSMKWHLERTKPGEYRIRCDWEGDSGYLTRLEEGKEANAVGLMPLNNKFVSQLWNLEPTADGGYRVICKWSPQSGALTRDSSTKDASGNWLPGNYVHLFAPATWSSQIWYFSQIPE